jgi:hypothetical protein
MSWTLLYLILGILVAVLGIWNLARGTNLFLSLLGIFWFAVILLRFYVTQINVTIVPQMTLAGLLEYLALPLVLILAFFTYKSRR